MGVERAVPSDVPVIEALLAAAGLPLEGVAEAFETGVVAREGAEVLGAAAVEPFGRVGLLRSVVVAESRRGTGVGRELVVAVETLARDEGIEELYLLTETAADWFPGLGYEVVDREQARTAVGESVEFTMACATTGVPMRRRLG
jgi:N-acetylglutamate synthase-like GNAT family acetyltransferase